MLAPMTKGHTLQVRAVKLRRDRIAVALDHRVLVYNFADLRLIYQWETIHNGKGLLAMSSEVDNSVVACPGVHAGQVLHLAHTSCSAFLCAWLQVAICMAMTLAWGKALASRCAATGAALDMCSISHDLQCFKVRQRSEVLFCCTTRLHLQVRLERMDRRDFQLIDAHNTQVTALALSLNGTRLATASEKGTLVRIFRTSDAAKLQELRRGSDPADVYHLAFDRKNLWLAVTSDKNTVHVFALRDEAEAQAHAQQGDQRPRSAMQRLPWRARPQAAPKVQPDTGGPTNKGSWFSRAQVCSALTVICSLAS